MKNLDMLETGEKPAPGQLVIIQGFINTLDIESGADQIGTKELLKEWLVRHGLIQSYERISTADLRIAFSLRSGLRSLLLANNGESNSLSGLKEFNQLLSRFPLVVSCHLDGTLSLVPSGQGMAAALGLILSHAALAVKEGTWLRLKACSEPNCQWVFYDGSKNHSGRWCSMSVCGSREKARAYRRRNSAKRANHKEVRK